MEPFSKTLIGIYIAKIFMQFHQDYIYDAYCNISPPPITLDDGWAPSPV